MPVPSLIATLAFSPCHQNPACYLLLQKKHLRLKLSKTLKIYARKNTPVHIIFPVRIGLQVLTQPHKKPRTKTKNSPKPALSLGPSPMGRGGHASQKTKKAQAKTHKKPHQKPTKSPGKTHKKPRQNPQKAPPKPTKSPTKTHKEAPPPQRPKPHHLMKCAKGTWRSHVPFAHFGGRGGTSSPHTKKMSQF